MVEQEVARYEWAMKQKVSDEPGVSGQLAVSYEEDQEIAELERQVQINVQNKIDEQKQYFKGKKDKNYNIGDWVAV
ncbi:hypothetical protein ILUMI_01621 [Ignelater luminosus]|uniref:Uncharacterized protein n=1 Tax=Ignelater luminosus TaxID=2038154 RepID=A0A8K0DQC4_IGNLU|nr:hypothetical protein ILUMI_01621 [Ignelater luminosus]